MIRQLSWLTFIIISGLFFIFFNKYQSHQSTTQGELSKATQLDTGLLFHTDNPLNSHLTFETHSGMLLNSEDFKGNYSVFFFGYTSCPSFCPEITQKMSAIMQALPRHYTHSTKSMPTHSLFKFYFVSIDPENDNPHQLSEFLLSYEAPIIGLRGSGQTIQEMAEYFRIHVAQARGADGHIAHSASLVVLNPLGSACAIMTDLNDSKKVAADLIFIEKSLRPQIIIR